MQEAVTFSEHPRSEAAGMSEARRLSPRASRALAWGLFGLALAMVAFDATFGVLGSTVEDAGSAWSTSFIGGLIFVLTLLAFPVVGLVLARRVPGNPIGWLLLAISICWGVALGTTYADYGLKYHPGAVPAANWVGGLTSSFWVPPVGLMGTFLFLLFPTGHLLTPRWRWVARLSGFMIVACTIVLLVHPGRMGDVGYPHTQNPFGIAAAGGDASVLQAVLVLVPVTILLSAASLILRYRRSEGIERLQMKWLAAAAGGVALVYGAVMVISAITSLQGGPAPGWVSVLENLSICTFALIPLAIGFGVLRYRLYDIDVIVRRTIVYAVLIAVLAILYLGGIALLGAATRALTGQSSALAVTVSTLVVAAAFQPLRSRIQRAVEHRFYRKTYDADVAVQGFSSRLREQIELDALSHELVSTVQETVQPRTVSIWLRSVTIPERPAGTKEA